MLCFHVRLCAISVESIARVHCNRNPSDYCVVTLFKIVESNKQCFILYLLFKDYVKLLTWKQTGTGAGCNVWKEMLYKRITQLTIVKIKKLHLVLCSNGRISFGSSTFKTKVFIRTICGLVNVKGFLWSHTAWHRTFRKSLFFVFFPNLAVSPSTPSFTCMSDSWFHASGWWNGLRRCVCNRVTPWDDFSPWHYSNSWTIFRNWFSLQ